MKIFIVDDEPHAISSIQALLENRINDFSFELLGSSSNPIEAIELINKLRPNVLFLDVEMPEYNGFELLEQISYKELMVVFVTAYRDYAVEAFKVNAIDYIVKPISPKTFYSCIERINKRLDLKKYNDQEVRTVIKKLNSKNIAVKSKDGYEIVNFEDVIIVKSEGAYSIFSLEGGREIIQSKNLKQSTNSLPDNTFKRISRSAIINLEKVVSFSFHDGGSITLCNGKELLIGKTYRSEVFAFLKERYIV